LFCNGPESCNAVSGCVSSGDPCGSLVCDEANDACIGCTAAAECDDGLDCTVDSCVLGACVNESEECVFDPLCRFHVANTACNCGQCQGQCCAFTPAAFGNVNCDPAQLVNLDDILCVLGGFSNPLLCPEGDVAPCNRNGVINLDDILGVLAAFGGANPCSCS
jgi:hypothetical protein